jgi:hypothetical protein
MPNTLESSANNGADRLTVDNFNQVTASEYVEYPDGHFLVAAQDNSIGVHDI